MHLDAVKLGGHAEAEGREVEPGLHVVTLPRGGEPDARRVGAGVCGPELGPDGVGPERPSNVPGGRDK